MSDLDRYNRQWLDGIRLTEHLIKFAPIDQVPIEHRSLIKQQFQAHVEAFRNDLSFGFTTVNSQIAILELVDLANELIKESAMKWVEWPAKAANGSR